METIIGLLIFLVPVIFKLIGKRLEQAGEMQSPVVDDTEPIENWEESLREYLETPSVVKPLTPEPMVKDSVEAPVAPKKPGKTKPVRKAPILVEEEKKQKEKIDVKKLIVYSEIMKPKYTEKNEY